MKPMSNFVLAEDPEKFEPDAAYEERIRLIMSRLQVSPASFSLLSARFIGHFKTSPFEKGYYPPSEDENEDNDGLDMMKSEGIQADITFQQQTENYQVMTSVHSPSMSGVKRKYLEIDIEATEEVVTEATESPVKSGNEGASSKENFSGVLIQEALPRSQQPNSHTHTSSHNDAKPLYASNFPSTNSPEDYVPIHSGRVVQLNNYIGSPELSLDDEDKIDMMTGDELENKENLSIQKDPSGVIEISDPSKPITINTDSLGLSVDSVVEIAQPVEAPPVLAPPITITSRKSGRRRGHKDIWNYAELSDEDLYVERNDRYGLEGNEKFGSGIAEELRGFKPGDPVSSGTFTSPTRTTNSVPRIDPKTPDRTHWNSMFRSAINSPQKTLRQISSPMTNLHTSQASSFMSPFQGINIERNVKEIEAFLNKDVGFEGAESSKEKMEISKDEKGAEMELNENEGD